MAKGQTIRESAHGYPPGVDSLIRSWNEDLVGNLLRLVWDAYDNVSSGFLSSLDWSEDYDDLERSISMELERAIRRGMGDYLPVDVQHGPFEHETRSAAKRNAQPPQYDIAFVWISDPRLMWPLEAKVIHSDSDTQSNLGDYIETVNTRYLTCYYAPFSNGGAMLGYLKSGSPDAVAGHIAKRLSCSLKPHAGFASRCHKTSDHTRQIPTGKDYPSQFRCHHLIMPLAGIGAKTP